MTDPDLSPLAASIGTVKHVGRNTERLLQKLGVYTVEDFLYFFPRAYEDRRKLPLIHHAKVSATMSLCGTFSDLSEHINGKKTILKGTLSDPTGKLALVWFNQAYLKKILKQGATLFVKGKVEFNRYTNRCELYVQETELINGDPYKNADFNRVLPIYPLVSGLHQKKMRTISEYLLTVYIPQLVDFLSGDLRSSSGLYVLHEAVREMHFPSQKECFIQSRNRLIFNEFFFVQLPYLFHKKKLKVAQRRSASLMVEGGLIEDYRSQLPYALTRAQDSALSDIKNDLQSGVVMNRLLQGDVGSGKTDIAILTLLMAVQSNKKAAFLVPTEILAQQHYLKILERVRSLGVDVYLLKGKMSKKEKDTVLDVLSCSETPLIVVGTHALIQDRVSIVDLGVVIVDEQHRFGVMQRMKLHEHGQDIHALYMTATPIPRSLMLTCYGDLDKSIIDELPPGRIAPKTYFVKQDKLDKVYQFCKSEIDNGRQVFIVFPLVEESEKMDLKSAEEGFVQAQNLFSNVGLIHGRMLPETKTQIMHEFKEKKTMVLVATTVIEVGIDIPNASTIVVMHAERFGLSQLHQLRGRVGRGSTESHCFLVADPKSEEGKQRIQAMLDTSDGFELAEMDLKIRGPGDMLGLRQSGVKLFEMADLTRDEAMMDLSRKMIHDILTEDPSLMMAKYKPIRDEMDRKSAGLVNSEVLN